MGADVMLDPNDLEKSFAPGRNFVTKLWNIGRFLLTTSARSRCGRVDAASIAIELCVAPTSGFSIGLERRDRASAMRALGPARPRERRVATESSCTPACGSTSTPKSARRFVWNELADWYLEAIKGATAARRRRPRGRARGARARVRLGAATASSDRAVRHRSALAAAADCRRGRGDFIARAHWPRQDHSFGSGDEFELVREAINAVRQLRADYAIPPGERISASLDASRAGISSDRDRSIFNDEADFISRIARCDIGNGKSSETAASILLSSGSRSRVPLAGVIDIEKECRKAKTELENLDAQLNSLNTRLANPGFTDRAPANVVEAERVKQGEWVAKRSQLAEKVASLCGS